MRALGLLCAAAALLLASGSYGHTDTTASATVEPKVTGTDWGDSAIALRNQPGSRFVYVCPASGRKDQVWGTHIYADNSSVCSAALHNGSFVYEDGAIVTIQHLPGQGPFTGSTQNGITSVSLASWPGSFQIVSAVNGSGIAGVKMGGAGWTASASRFRGQIGVRYRYICPGGAINETLYGSNTHRRQLCLHRGGVRRPLHACNRRPRDHPDRGGSKLIQVCDQQQHQVEQLWRLAEASPSWVLPWFRPEAAAAPTTTGGGGSATPPTGTAAEPCS